MMPEGSEVDTRIVENPARWAVNTTRRRKGSPSTIMLGEMGAWFL
jgi:hypothetical protein